MTSRDEAAAAFAAQIRELLDVAVRTEASAEELEGARQALAEVTARLSGALRSGPRERHPEDLRTGANPLNAAAGAANPWALPVALQTVPDGIVGTVTLGSAYEGPPGHVHGGAIALLFDQLLGTANVVAGTPGMTVELALRYRRPTPLWTELTFDCRHSGVEGRRIQADGVLVADGVETVEASGTFALPRHRAR